MSATDEFLTPHLIADAFEEMGGVGLDPCSNWGSLVPARTLVMRPENFKARLVTPSVNAKSKIVVGSGLETPWEGHGLVYCNPPYSSPAPWVDRGGDVEECVMLLPASTSEKWWGRFVVPHYDEVLFFDGRLKFLEIDGGVVRPASDVARFASALVYKGQRVELFRDVFQSCGWFVPCRRS